MGCVKKFVTDEVKGCIREQVENDHELDLGGCQPKTWRIKQQVRTENHQRPTKLNHRRFFRRPEQFIQSAKAGQWLRVIDGLCLAHHA